MRFSANLGFLWAELPLEDRLGAAARAGFRAVELHWPYETPAEVLANAAQAAGVTVLALNSPRGDLSKGEFGLACLPGREADFLDSFRQAEAYARAIGAGAIHVMAGKPQDEAWRDRLIANLQAAADEAPDLTLLIEPLNTKDNPGYAYATLAEAAAIHARVGRPNLRLMLDAYHEAMAGLDPAAAWRDHRDIIGHVQIAGVPDRAEPGLASPPLSALMTALSEAGYDGWIGCEYRPRITTEAGLGWLR